jgi:hypothetical protein
VWIASLVGTLDFVSTRIGWGDDHLSRFPFCAGSSIGIHGGPWDFRTSWVPKDPAKHKLRPNLLSVGDPYAEARISQHLFGLNNFSAWTTFAPNNFFGLNNFRSSISVRPQQLFGLDNFSAWTTFGLNNFSVSTTFGLNRVRSQQRFGFHPSFGSHPPSGSHPPFGLNHLSVCCTETRVPCNCAVPAAVRSQRSFLEHSGVTQIGLPGWTCRFRVCRGDRYLVPLH